MCDTSNYKKGDFISFNYGCDNDYEGIVIKNLKYKMVINVLKVNGCECYTKCYGNNEYKFYNKKYTKEQTSVESEYDKRYFRYIKCI